YNRNASKMARWREQHQGNGAPTPAAAVADAEIALMCVGNDDDVRAVALGADGALSAMRKGAIFVDHTTASAQIAREIYAAAQSWQMENRGKTMLADKFDFGFAVDWMRKDLGLCIAEARSKGASLPVTALVDQFYARVQAQGGGRWDSSSLLRVLRDPR